MNEIIDKAFTKQQILDLPKWKAFTNNKIKVTPKEKFTCGTIEKEQWWEKEQCKAIWYRVLGTENI